MNIAIFTDTFPPEINGVATSTYNLYRVLKEKNHNVFVICTNPFSRKVTFDGDVLRIPGLELKKLYSYRISNFYNSKAMRIIKKMKPNIIHTNTEAGIGLFGRIVARRLKIPLVHTYHTMIEDYTYYITKGKGLFDKFAKSIVRKYSRFLAEKSTEFVVPSEKTKDILRGYGMNSYINVVPTGIDFKKYKAENIDNTKLTNLKKQYGIEDCFVVLSLGRVAKEKSIDLCIKGFNEFANTSRQNSKMLIVGGGPALIELEQLVHELNLEDKVIFTGPVSAEEVPLYYNLADLFVSASITETQGLTFMESMAARKLILCRFDENLVDVIYDGKTGFFFENEQDFKVKVNKILNLKSDEKEKILDNASELVGRYSIDNFYNNIMEVYKRAIRKQW